MRNSNEGGAGLSKLLESPKACRFLIFFRYLLPCLTGVAFLLMSLFYSVRAAQGGREMWFSTSRLVFNTLKTARAYLTSGAVEAGRRDFYVLLLVGAVLALLCFLLAAFFAGYAAVLAFRVFRGNLTGEEIKRQKILFKVIFPNRACYFSSGLLYFLPAFFPEYFSFACTRFLEYSGGSTILYVQCNLPLIVLGLLTALTLAVALLAARVEAKMGMDLFHIDSEVPDI